MPRRATLCIAPVGLLNGIGRPEASTRVALVELPPEAFVAGENTTYVDFSKPWLAAVSVVDWAGNVQAELRVPANELFNCLRLAPAIRELLNGSAVAAESAVPAFLITQDAGSDSAAPSLHVYSQVRFSLRDALFIRTTAAPLTDAGWLQEAVRLHAQSGLFLNNHQCYYRKCLAGKELEVKFTFEAPVDIWSLNADLYAEIGNGGLPGYIAEYFDEFQQWDYPTRLYEVLSPETERGYVSFIPTTDGRFIMKQKRFGADALIREEAISKPQNITGSLEAHLARSLGVQYRKLPALRRVRYDVNFESLDTGHVYGVFFDRVSAIGAEHVNMHQCELEYLRSRTVLPPNEAAIFEEFHQIRSWVARFLEQRTLRFSEGYYSKLSFLRDATADGRLPFDPAPEVLA